MIEISENLHRAELSALERGKLVKEWKELVGETISRQVAEKKGRGRPESGNSQAARELNLDEKDVRRSVKIASLSPEAQAVAVETGLDKNQSALLEAAKHTEPEQQETTENASAPTGHEKTITTPAEKGKPTGGPCQPAENPARDLSQGNRRKTAPVALFEAAFSNLTLPALRLLSSRVAATLRLQDGSKMSCPAMGQVNRIFDWLTTWNHSVPVKHRVSIISTG